MTLPTLVKGAYREPADKAFPGKRDVDANYFALAKRLLGPEARRTGVRAIFGTHDKALIRRFGPKASANDTRGAATPSAGAMRCTRRPASISTADDTSGTRMIAIVRS